MHNFDFRTYPELKVSSSCPAATLLRNNSCSKKIKNHVILYDYMNRLAYMNTMQHTNILLIDSLSIKRPVLYMWTKSILIINYIISKAKVQMCPKYMSVFNWPVVTMQLLALYNAWGSPKISLHGSITEESPKQ